MSDESNQPVVLPDSSNHEPLAPEVTERRRMARYSFIATAEVRDLRSQTRIAGRCSDLSMGGCYVDTLAPLAVGSLTRVSIHHDSREFSANAVVVYAHPSMGMGVTFTDVQDDSRELLRFWIADLSGDSKAGPGPEKIQSIGISSAESEPHLRLVLNELITLLVRKKILTETEGAELLMHAFR
ncbi:MAG TPA: PilZ domain-containing protein [Candidatus Acidoferrales bacterium]|jgi:hypothetical protein|nr:PilZ domain-containing protein [Candidatus Acidoferrales bacterium]